MPIALRTLSIVFMSNRLVKGDAALATFYCEPCSVQRRHKQDRKEFRSSFIALTVDWHCTQTPNSERAECR